MAFNPLTSVFMSAFGLAAVTVWRIRESQTAVTLKKIIIPPMGMATGFSMFIAPGFRIPLAWAGLAFVLGAGALAWPLLLTTRLERRGGVIMMKRSNAFLAVLLALAAIRFGARSYFDTILSAEQTAGVFFTLAFGMILCWRVKMLIDFRRLTSDPATQPA